MGFFSSFYHSFVLLVSIVTFFLHCASKEPEGFCEVFFHYLFNCMKT